MSDLKKYRVATDQRVRWGDFDPDDIGPFKKKEDALDDTEQSIQRLDDLQEKLYAEGKHALLIILQGMDTGGKDGTIQHVLRGINPQGCHVNSFKVPTAEEQAHDFLWRVHAHVPAKGFVGIFNRSHYEDVLVVRVHGQISDSDAEKRFREINDFEKLLVDNGTTVLKFFLAITKDEQKRRLQSRLDDSKKRWKFNPADLTERGFWDKYQDVYADAISATSTKYAPWYVIPANHKWYRNYLVANIITAALEEIDPKFPPAPKGLDYSKVTIPD